MNPSTTFGRVIRSLRRSPGFVAIATISMGVALGISTSVFAVMDAMTHPTPPFRDVEQLYRVEFGVQLASPPPRDSIIAGVARLEGVARVASWRYGQREMGIVNGRVAAVDVGRVDPFVLDLLGVRPRLGRLLTPGDFGGGNVAVVTDMVWRRDFANRSSIGDATVQVGDRSYRIVGVLPTGVDRAIRTDVFVPAEPGELLWSVLVRLKPGVGVEQFQPRLKEMNERLTKALAGPTDRGVRAFIGALKPDPLQIRDFHRAMVGGAICILLIACANVAALMLARGLAKKRDYALRLALGAQPYEIGREVLLEIAILALAGCLAGVVVTSWFVGLIGRAMPPEMAWQGFVQPQWSWRVLAMAMGAVVASIVVAGGFPAWSAARTDPAGPLKEGAASTTGRTQTRFRWLVIAELAIAMTLLMSTSLMQKSVRLMGAYEFGYPIERMVSAGVALPWRKDSTTQENAAARRQQGLEILRATPGVEAAIPGVRTGCGGIVNQLVSDRTTQGGPLVDLRGGPAFRGKSPCTVVGPRFFATYGVDVVEGRDFQDGDLSGPGSAIVDQSTARKLFRGEPAVGRMLKLGGLDSPNPWVPIVGVVRDHVLGFDPHPELGRDTSVTVYFSQRNPERYGFGGNYPSLDLAFTVRSGPDVERTRLAILKALEPLTPSNGRAYVLPQDQSFQNQLKTEEFLGLVFTLLGLASLVLGAAGLYSVISYVAGQRMREFAVRIALGATKQNVAKLVLREAFTMAIGGTAVGAGFGMWAAFLLWDRMWGVYPVDVQALIVAESVLILTTMAACLVPALRAAKSDPLEVMRAT